MTVIPADDILDLLRSLVDKSLVVYEEHDGVGRYRLLETVRQYGQEKLTESGQAEAVQDRAASWFLTLAQEAEPQLAGPEQALWLERLEIEHDNLRASLGRYEQQAEGAEAGLRLAGALWRFWWVRGHLSEGRQWLNRALERTKESSQKRAEEWEALAARAKALHGAGILTFWQGDYAGARSLCEASLTIYWQLEDQSGIAASLRQLGSVLSDQGEYVEAQTLFEESLMIRRLLGHQAGIADSLACLGHIAYRQGDYPGARTQYEESLTIERQLRNQGNIAWSLKSLGRLAYQQGEYAEARALFEESLMIMRWLGNQQGIAISLSNLGDIADRQGDFALSRTLHEESLTLYRQLGNQEGIADSLEGLSGVARGQNHLSRAARLFGAASSLRETLGIPVISVEQKVIAQRVASVCEALGEDAFAAAWDAGRAMTLDQAIAYALGDAHA